MRRLHLDDFDPYAVAPPAQCDPPAWLEPFEDSDIFPDPTLSSCGESAVGSTVVDLTRIAYPEGVHWLRSWLMNWDHTPFSHAVDAPVSITLAECPELPDGEVPPDDASAGGGGSGGGE